MVLTSSFFNKIETSKFLVVSLPAEFEIIVPITMSQLRKLNTKLEKNVNAPGFPKFLSYEYNLINVDKFSLLLEKATP